MPISSPTSGRAAVGEALRDRGLDDRAFDTGLLTGDRGASGLGALAYRPISKCRFQASELHIFGDGGTFIVRVRDGVPVRHVLASAGIGARAR